MLASSILRKALIMVMAAGLMVSGVALAADSSLININTATVEELTMLEGVGQTYAQRIIAYRENHGPFTSIEQITEVKGIGQKTLEKNKHRITVGTPGQ